MDRKRLSSFPLNPQSLRSLVFAAHACPSGRPYRIDSDTLAIQMRHDGNLPEQDNIYAVYATLLKAREDRDLREDLLANRLGRAKDKVPRQSGDCLVYWTECSSDGREGGSEGEGAGGTSRYTVFPGNGNCRNGSSIPPRLPQLSAVLKALDERPYTLIAVSYRGFWTSRGRASQRGIERDAVAALRWAGKTYPHPNTRLVLWGQSIGAGVATFLAASHHQQHGCSRRSEAPALILETPFVSVRSMLLALYPQRWLPYRYLGPFLRNWWDSEEALRSISNPGSNGTGKRKVLVVSAEKDELVPSEQADVIEKLCIEGGMDVSRTRVRGALHTEATFRGDGRNAVVSFLKRL
ncbi:Alpha/beta superfamily hydrolase [Trichophyton interdigitale]|uniref:Alpha/beta superfamily hydrolase n=2 Tax=Trichophyton interdigitale TaxID=101480 RepID=A0A9P4YJB8_9EURO|nr:Alpha/beta superfamily hydrolase [Trichophyton interdigitale]KAF3900558.1 Alpha/beta superfamily hydrolase [Trichophyton interdigitale]KAG8210539.1 Alpha/beta superfamily hydrolase [Trichophyton interdigitale]KDB21312.1 hypothetical protein H109_06749 [Trichophyton interdigitale MR816]